MGIKEAKGLKKADLSFEIWIVCTLYVPMSWGQVLFLTPRFSLIGTSFTFDLLVVADMMFYLELLPVV